MRSGSDDADGRPAPGGPLQGWGPFAVLLLGGIAIVFLYELIQLVLSLWRVQGGTERGAVWAMLFLVFALFVAVLLIGGGLLLAIRRYGLDREKDVGTPGEGST